MSVVEQLREDRQIGAALRAAEALRPEGYSLVTRSSAVGAQASYVKTTPFGNPVTLALGAGKDTAEALERLVGHMEAES